MLELIERIRERLAQSAYANEAAISHGVVTPILNALGWDSADPNQLVPEYSIPPRGRVDFALFGLGHKPAVFLEVKGLGRAMDGDRQLFEYAFHKGAPLCVLTDGREWSFYVPGGHGSYEDRRVYRLQLDDRDPTECRRILTRYLARERVRDGSAFEDAQRDYRDAAGKREAATALPRAWSELLDAPEELLLDIVGDRAEALCGYKPAAEDVLTFLHSMRPIGMVGQPSSRRHHRSIGPKAVAQSEPSPVIETIQPAAASASRQLSGSSDSGLDRRVRFRLLGEERTAANAAAALVEVLGVMARHEPSKVETLAAAVRGPKRNLIARSVNDINPARPDLARAVEFAPGWLVGLNISNREKMAILRTAADTFGLRMPEDLDLTLPNA